MTSAPTDVPQRTAAIRWALEASNLDKSFGGTPALRRAHLAVAPGRIHALLGGNGSGKSTLIKCVAGVYSADAGEVSVHGVAMPAAQITPRTARDAGLRFVHQDPGMFATLTVAENLALSDGFPTTAWQGIQWRHLHDAAADLLERFDIRVRPTDAVGDLRPSQQTMVAIARALADQGGSDASGHILILDEPTASLPENESADLMRALRARADAGQTIVLVSHRFREIDAVADDVTVFRDGRVAGTGPTREMSSDHVVDLMTGTTAGATTATPTAPTRPDPAAAASRDGSGPPAESVFTAAGLAAGSLAGLDLSVSRGEIVGLAGLAGSGRSSVLRAVFGDLPLQAGSMHLKGQPHRPAGPGDAVSAGVAFVPENRVRDAAFLDMSVRENATMTRIGRYWRRLVMDLKTERAETRSLIERHAIRTSGTELAMASLSGGNQQKVVLGRWLQQDPDLLLLDEPTQGVDVMSRREIYATLHEIAAEGCAMVVASSDLDELMELCDRIVVLTDGRPIAEFSTRGLRREELAAAVLTGAPAAQETKGTEKT